MLPKEYLDNRVSDVQYKEMEEYLIEDENNEIRISRDMLYNNHRGVWVGILYLNEKYYAAIGNRAHPEEKTDKKFPPGEFIEVDKQSGFDAEKIRWLNYLYRYQNEELYVMILTTGNCYWNSEYKKLPKDIYIPIKSLDLLIEIM